MKLLRKPIACILFFLLLAATAWILWANTALTLTQYHIQNAKIPAAFNGFRIAQISDLHNTEFGPGNRELLTLLADTQPDVILITGDLVDSRKTDPEIAAAFVREAGKIAPVYYAPGNHESRLPEIYAVLKADIATSGGTVLENESRLLEKDSAQITLTGLTDPDFGISWPDLPANTYQIVLSHRPELLTQYAQMGFDLVLSGHAHGGQFRLPRIGGLYAPHQGFLPRYTSGIHTLENTTLVISRGLGNSLFPLRLGNRPELILITLESI